MQVRFRENVASFESRIHQENRIGAILVRGAVTESLSHSIFSSIGTADSLGTAEQYQQ
jgi:hypothetical protein